MGRPRQFDEHQVLARAASAFRQWNYAGTSMDALVEATRLQRGSVYGAFGSKRGLFLASLAQAVQQDAPVAVDLLLIALLELAPDDAAARSAAAEAVERLGAAATPGALGRRLMERAGVPAASSTS